MPAFTEDQKPMIAYEDAITLFSYNPETGAFSWNKKTNRWAQAGDSAGCIRADGYLVITLNKKKIYGHRLAWLFSHGVWPNQDIDHINGNPSDNRISNLRAATRSQNLQNQKVGKNSTTGIRGCSWIKSLGKFRVRLQKDRKIIHIGLFDTKTQAKKASILARIKHFGEFANRN